MDCAFEFGPHPKKSRNSDVHLGKCWLCDKHFEQKQDVGHPDPGQIQVLFDSIRAANDNEKLLAKVNAQEDDIVAGQISVKYHHNCRSSYLLKRPHAYLSEQNVRPMRSSFNFKELCFVCAKSCDRRCKRDRKRGWALITDKDNIFAHVHAEAILKGDTDTILRLNGIECKDMVAADCRYHRGNKLCLSKYLGLNDKIETNKPAQSRKFAPEEVQCSTSAAALLELNVSADEGSEMCISSEEYTDWPSNIQEQNYTSQIQSKDQAIYGVVSLLRADIAAMTQKKLLIIQNHLIWKLRSARNTYLCLYFKQHCGWLT